MSEASVPAPELIETPASFQELVVRLQRQTRIAVDTESNSLHAYRERVCLLQFSTAERDFVLDPLAVHDLAALGPVFQNPGIEKIFHAAEYDIICLRRDYGFEFASIFDTMQAGRILGRKLAGLDRLLEDKFAIKVSKRFQKADWGIRPLSPALLQYAAQDTHYLLPLRDVLHAELREHGLLDLAHEDFRMACNHASPAQPAKRESPAWQRLRARRDLTPQERAVLKELVDWREEVAAGLDRPPFKVMGDDGLVALARSQPSDVDGLRAAGITERQAHQWGKQLIAAIQRGVAQQGIQRPRSALPSAAYLKRLEDLKQWRKKVAAGLQVESDVVLPRALLLALAEGGSAQMREIMRASPWRLRRFGDEIAAVLAPSMST